MSPLPETDHAGSPIIGIVAMMSITIILAALVLLLCLGFHILQAEAQVPAIFVMERIVHVNPYGILDYDSYVVIRNAGKKPYDNRNLNAKVYRNGIHLTCDIPSMNGNTYLPTHHFGVQKLGGLGSQGTMWYPGATLFIDYAKGTFHPEDTIVFEVYDTTTGQILSRDTYPPEKKYTVKWFYNYFLNPQAV